MFKDNENIQEKRDDIAKLMGFAEWEDVDTDLYPVAEMLEKYIPHKKINDAIKLSNIETFNIKDVKKNFFLSMEMKDFYATYKSENTVEDAVAKSVYLANNYNFGLVRQAVLAIANIRDIYFPKGEKYNANTVMKILEDEVFERNEIFSMTETNSISEKVEIYKKVMEIMQKSIDPAAVMMSVDNLLKVDDGDGKEYFENKETKAANKVAMLEEARPEKGMLEELLGTMDIKDENPLLIKIVRENFSKEDIKEFLETRELKEVDYYFSKEFEENENTIKAIVYSAFEKNFFNENIAARNIEGGEKLEKYKVIYDKIKERVLNDIILDRRTVLAKSRYTNFFPHKKMVEKVIKEKENGNATVVVEKDRIERAQEKLRLRLRLADMNEAKPLPENTTKNNRILEKGKVYFQKKLALSLQDVVNSSFSELLIACGRDYKTKKRREQIIEDYSMDKLIEKSLVQKAKEYLEVDDKKEINNRKDIDDEKPINLFDVYIVEPDKDKLRELLADILTHTDNDTLKMNWQKAHIDYIIENAESNKSKAIIPVSNIEFMLTQEEVIKMAHKESAHKKLVEFTHYEISRDHVKEVKEMLFPLEEGLRAETLENVAIEILPESRKGIIVKKGAFGKANLDENGRIRSIEVINPDKNGKLVGYRLTAKGERELENHWEKRIKEMHKDNQAVEKTIKPKIRRLRK